ncbi:adenosine 3'-phospho 5'-phosphosulfate transporter 2-like [Salvelinus fontinalis]|uniref:adenosine 3'-phospho 5'-phosphosulfate transporter 2-like n=1 Tax=Salvelinus fontinalis TaxID=8038 RepID=UPI0024864E61|nr:adenosine 3'-phospho 5'-phosphosulfate transporter 2-like [Salvelinus fontinalis]
MSDKFGPMNYNNARKHLSITIPSSSEVTMSPHIKSVEELRVLGINLSSFNTATQFGICTVGIFLFHLLYGYLQGLIFSMEGFKPFGWYLSLVQFGFYSPFGLVELQLTQDKRRRIPGKTYMIIAFLTVGTMGLSNTSLGYLNYPTQVIFKCCKLIPVMIGGIFIQGKRNNLADVLAALCMSLGLIWFTLADSKVTPNFNATGVLLISLALCADAAIGNVQEKAMKLHNSSSSEIVLRLWVHIDRPVWCGWIGTSSGLLLSASCDDIRLCILLLSHGILWHFICAGLDQTFRSPGHSHSDGHIEPHP